MQFLLEGARQGEAVLYITLSETEMEIRSIARRHGWSLDGITMFELVPPETSLDPDQELTVLYPAELELSETTKLVFDRVSALNPSRIVFDSLSELRLLAQTALRYRRQVLALKHFFTRRDCTVVMLDGLSARTVTSNCTPSCTGSSCWTSWESPGVASAAVFGWLKCGGSSSGPGSMILRSAKGAQYLPAADRC